MQGAGEDTTEEPTPIAERREKIKEQILDETFKKAEVTRGIRESDDGDHKKKTYEKTFPKVGIALIIIAIIGLIFITKTPWGYIRYGAENEISFGSNTNNINGTILNLFKSPYYLGLSADDFSFAYSSALYGFVSLIIFGIAITIFGIFDKMRNFSIETFILIHFIFVSIIIIPGILITLAGIKILGAHFLFYHNASLIFLKITFLSFPAAIAAVVLGLITAKLMFTVMRMDFNALQKIKELEDAKSPFARYSVGGKV